jgi:hypothetical protein
MQWLRTSFFGNQGGTVCDGKCKVIQGKSNLFLMLFYIVFYYWII